MISTIAVDFALPNHISEGLLNGAYERVGGVIRHSNNKRVIAWLSEVGKDTVTQGNVLSILSDSNLVAGLQVANLAVSAAGFAFTMYKLNQVHNELNALKQKVNGLQQSTEWLDKKQFIQQLAPVLEATSTLASAHNFRSSSVLENKLLTAADTSGVAYQYFKNLLSDFLINKLEGERPAELAAVYRAWLLSAGGRIQAMSHLEELDIAYFHAEELKVDHSKFGKSLLEVRKSTAQKILRTTNKQSDAILSNLLNQSAGAHKIITGKVLQLEHMKEHGIKLKDLINAESAYKNTGYVLHQL